MKIAVIDVDGVVANISKRIAKAEEAKVAREQELTMGIPCMGEKRARIERECTKAYWKTAFDPSLVVLDELIPGAKEALYHLEEQGLYIVFMTSRPETMKQATVQWLGKHEIMTGTMLAGTSTFFGVAHATTRYGRDLIMKPMGKQFTKTVDWKASEVKIMADLDVVESILFVDDEVRNRNAIEALNSPKVTCKPDLLQIVQQNVTAYEIARKQLTAMLGPAPQYSEHKVGEIVKYSVGNGTKQGTILHVCAAGQQVVQNGKVHGMEYIVDGGTGFPDVVLPGDIIAD